MESTDTESLFYTANSALNTDYFPDNDPAEFTNLFPYTIVVREPKKYYIKLCTISISRELDNGLNIANNLGYIKIFINELEPNIVNSEYDKCIGKFSYRAAIQKTQFPVDYIIHEFKESPFLELLTVPLTHISIRITDSRNNTLKVQHTARPTLIDFELVEMDTTGKFTMTFMSHGREELLMFPNNTLTAFSVKCPKEIRLRRWEAALVSIAYPPDINSDTNVWWTAKSTNPDIPESKFEFNLLDYPNTERFLLDVFDQLGLDENYNTKVGFSVVEEGEEEGFIKLEGLAGLQENDEQVQVAFSHGFSKAMGQLEIQPPGSIAVGHWITFQGIASITLALPPSVALLTCSCINASAVGHELAPVLRTIPVNTAKGDYLYEPEHLIWHPVVNRSFTDVAFVLRKPNGEPHELHSRVEHLVANGGIVITMLFRPRPLADGNQPCQTVGVGNC